MSKNWVQDIHEMHAKFGFHEKRNILTLDQSREYLSFRYRFLQEELAETGCAIEHGDAEEVVDGLIDLCVVAIGTLDFYGIDAYKAWDEVLRANLAKEVGIKAGRPNPLGLPDLCKPAGWVAPSHEGNHGNLQMMFAFTSAEC